MVKRTYSRRNMSMMPSPPPNGQDEPRGSPRKRQKTAASSRSQNRKQSTNFNGPVSIPEEQEQDSAQSIDKALRRLSTKPSAELPVHPPIHGSRSDFDKYVASKRRSSSRKPAKNSADVTKAQIEGGNGPNLKKGGDDAVPLLSETTEFSASLNEGVMTYSSPTVPKRDLLRRPVAPDSKVAQIWEANRTKSPLLNVPGEVRNCIYELVLGGKTVFIGFQNYAITMRDKSEMDAYGREHVRFDEVEECLPVYRYFCRVYDGLAFPGYLPYVSPADPCLAMGFTLLNRVCRQLYMETAVLPYKFSRIGFQSHLNMFNFIYMEKRLNSAQRGAITRLYVQDQRPNRNLLALLESLEEVIVGQGGDDPRYLQKYMVVRDDQGPRLVEVASKWNNSTQTC